MAELIYHLVPQSYHQQQSLDQPYIPAAFAVEGFIHCTAQLDLLLQVADHYFADLSEPLLVYAIDPAQLTSPVKYEPPIKPGPPAKPDGSESPDKKSSVDPNEPLFPHIYGPLNRTAIIAITALNRRLDGGWAWPE